MNSKLYSALLLFVLLPTTILANKIEQVELIYDSTEVYPGNKIIFYTKVTDNKGNIHLSHKNSSRFDLDEFIVTASETIHVHEEEGYFTLDVPRNTTLDVIEVNLEKYYGFSKDFAFSIPIIHYEKKIRNIHLIIDESKVINRSEVTFELWAELNNGITIKSEKTGKLPHDLFYLNLEKGGELNTIKQTISVNATKTCNNFLILQAGLKSNPSIRTQVNLQINTPTHPQLNFLSTHSKDKTSRNQNKFNGKDGASGSKVSIYLDLIPDPCSQGDSVLFATVKNTEGETIEEVRFFKDTSIFSVYCNGEDGQNGKDGFDGKDGRNGKNYILEAVREVSDPTDGERGGDGGNGGDGGMGGDGGSIIIYFTKVTEPYLDQLNLHVEPGKGGTGGRGGLAGKGGLRGNGGDYSGVNGQNGSNGKNGRDGRDGRKGEILFVNIK